MSQSAPLAQAGRGSVLGAVLLLTAACGDPTTPRESAVAVTSATAPGLAAAPALKIAGVGGTIVAGVVLPLTATLMDPAAPLPNASLAWRTSNAAVATVSSAGVVTAVAPGTATIMAALGGANRASSAGSSSAVGGTTVITVTEGALLSPQNGGTISSYAGDVTLVLPPGALTMTTPITVTLDLDAPNTPNTVGPAYDFGPTGTQFNQPVEMALTYDPALLPPDTDQGTLRVARLEDGVWVPLTEAVSVDSSTNTVRAATRHFSRYRVVVDPCAVKNGNPTVINGTITTSDCLFLAPPTTSRYSDYYQMVPPANTVTVIRWTRAFSGVFGMKESTANVAAGLVYGSIAGTTPELRIIGNGDPMQLFVSGANATTTGAYTLTKSAAVGHACYTAAPILYLVPGASFQDAVTSQNSCAFTAQYSPFAEVNGKPLLAHYLVTKLDAGKQYTISVSGMPGQSALTIFRSGVAAQHVGPTVNGVRTVTVTPATAGNYTIEISSGGFQFANFQGDWTTPVINYTLSVSRGVTP